jgi:hypothetical protein
MLDHLLEVVLAAVQIAEVRVEPAAKRQVLMGECTSVPLANLVRFVANRLQLGRKNRHVPWHLVPPLPSTAKDPRTGEVNESPMAFF